MCPTVDPAIYQPTSQKDSREPYVGRFAPSPTGQLHFGSLVAAVASFADAKHHNGTWLLRIDDVDQGRTVPGAAEEFMITLKAFGFNWDGSIHWQSQRENHYREAINQLRQRGLAYPCRCSRRQIEATGRHGENGVIYPGTCRTWDGTGSGQLSLRLRLRTEDREIKIHDQICNAVSQNLGGDSGDFIIRRADGFTAYQLAVVVDDFLDQVTHVVRGADLALSTPRQVYLQQLLDYPTPTYAHVPLVRDRDGRKISKRDDARPVQSTRPLPALQAAWIWLGQQPLHEPCRNVDEFWAMAIPKWSMQALSDLHPLPIQTHKEPRDRPA